MHNKRIGRDDLLKIEVRRRVALLIPTFRSLTLALYSGLVLPPRHRGDSTLVATASVVASVVVTAASAALLALLVAGLPAHAVPATTPLAKMTAVTATATTTGTAATLATAPVPLIAGKWPHIGHTARMDADIRGTVIVTTATRITRTSATTGTAATLTVTTANVSIALCSTAPPKHADRFCSPC